MSEKPERTRRGWTAACFVVLTLIYVLSVGPMLVVLRGLGVGKDGWVNAVFGAFYRPVTVIAQLAGLTEQLGDYLNWWLKHFEP